MSSEQTSPPKADEKKKMDPGWNDPPMLNYSATNPPPKSRITNKRIAFPISGPSSSAPPTTSQSAPPPCPPKD
ncbi:hypothetical protein TcasGA2_TC034213 [Tribolium castaneum]|uniref:Uncharacterized protein n=1 Tax=Tribolium castaneum TaxID=7070 RepID=A0A139WP88_TRICA|nr:hypothetical protein TcasGA2_TC034213 [Tribolium castaneum]